MIMKKTEQDLILSKISRNAKTIEEYKEALHINNIVYIEMKTGDISIVVPACVYNKMTKAERNKLAKLFK